MLRQHKDLFTSTVAILDSSVSDIYFVKGQIHTCTNFPPEHPIITIWNNRIQNGQNIGKEVYYQGFHYSFQQLPFTVYDFTLSNARQFYSSKGDPIGVKGFPKRLICAGNNMVERFTTQGLVIWTFCDQIFHLTVTCRLDWEQGGWKSAQWMVKWQSNT